MEDFKVLSLCRVCLQDGASLPIFETGEGESILTKLSLCVREKVEDIDGFPRHICSLCNTTLETISNFIHKFRESNKILTENGLKIVKTELSNTFNDSDHGIFEVEIDIKDVKAESDTCDVSLAHIVKPPIIRKKKIKQETCKKEKKPAKTKKQMGNITNKIASSILEGSFLWNGEKWCMEIGQTTIRKGTGNTNPRPQTKIKLTPTKKEPSEKLCDICGDVFKTQDKLSFHKKKAHFQVPAQCPKCPRICASEYYLNRHIKRKHESKRDYMCTVCGRGFTFKGELTTHHNNVHTNKLKQNKSFPCKYCDKIYKCAKSVVIHERSVHTGQRPAVCSICGNSFYHEEYLREHMRLHTGETPFKCPICGRGYAQRCNMKSHLRIHRVSELDAVTLSKLRPNYLKLLKV